MDCDHTSSMRRFGLKLVWALSVAAMAWGAVSRHGRPHSQCGNGQGGGADETAATEMGDGADGEWVSGWDRPT